MKRTLLQLAIYLEIIMKCAFNKKKGMTAGTESDKLFAQETGNIKADDGLLSIGDSTPASTNEIITKCSGMSSRT